MLGCLLTITFVAATPALTSSAVPTGATTVTAVRPADNGNNNSARRVLYVSTAGRDYNPDRYTTPVNTAARPWRTIAMAIRRAQPGDTIQVAGGVYVEAAGWGAVPGRRDAPIVLQAAPGERVVIKGTLQLDGADYWTVRRINVTYNPARPRTQFLVKFNGGTGWQLLDSEIWGTRGVSNVFISGLKPNGSPHNYRIAGNCIHDNQATGDPSMNDHNIYLTPGYASGPGVIEHNILFNARNGAQIKAAGSNASSGAAQVLIEHNTMAYSPVGVVVSYGTNRITMRGNLFGPRLGADNRYASAVVGNHVTGTRNHVVGSAVWAYPNLVRSTKDSRSPVTSAAVVRVTPKFNAMNRCTGFRPTDRVAAAYGRYVGTAR